MPGHLQTPFYTRIMSRITGERDCKRVWLAPEDSPQLLSQMRAPSYTGYHCCGGTNVLFIEEDGATRGGVCSASPTSPTSSAIATIGLVQGMRPVSCTSMTCASMNIPLPKFTSEAEAEACTVGFRNRAKAYLYRAEAAQLERPTPV